VKEDYHPSLIVWHFVGNPAHFSFRANIREVATNVLGAEEIIQYPQQDKHEQMWLTLRKS
jgi:hypothetical protein